MWGGLPDDCNSWEYFLDRRPLRVGTVSQYGKEFGV